MTLSSTSEAAAQDAAVETIDGAGLKRPEPYRTTQITPERAQRKAEASVEYYERELEAAEEAVAKHQDKAERLAVHADSADEAVAAAHEEVAAAKERLAKARVAAGMDTTAEGA